MHTQTFTIHDQRVAAAQQREDHALAAHLRAVRNTGRAQGFLIGVLVMMVVLTIWG